MVSAHLHQIHALMAHAQLMVVLQMQVHQRIHVTAFAAHMTRSVRKDAVFQRILAQVYAAQAPRNVRQASVFQRIHVPAFNAQRAEFVRTELVYVTVIQRVTIDAVQRRLSSATRIASITDTTSVSATMLFQPT